MRASITKLSDSDAAICLRVSDARCLLGLDQATFGAVIDLSRDRLASYENLRAPLRYAVADRICQAFQLNQRWLATGQLPMFRYVEIPPSIGSLVKERDLFSVAFKEIIGKFVSDQLVTDARALGCAVKELDQYVPPNATTISRLMVQEGSLASLNALLPLLIAIVRKGYEAVPESLRWKYYRVVSNAVSQFFESDSSELAGLTGSGKRHQGMMVKPGVDGGLVVVAPGTEEKRIAAGRKRS